MTAVRFYSRKAVLQLLAPYGCKIERVLADGTELWVTGWNEYFTLSPDSPDGSNDIKYDFWQIQQVFANVIGPTMPPSMGGNGNHTKKNGLN